MAENHDSSLRAASPQRKESLWKRSKKFLDANQITFLQPLLKDSEDKPARQKKQGSTSPKTDPLRRREQVRQAQRTHRERTQNYMKALEMEVVRLREVETRMVGEKDALLARVNALEHTLSLHAIPIPTATDNDLTSLIDGSLREHTANVTLRHDGSHAQVLSVEMPSFTSNMSTRPNQRENASFGDSQLFNTNHIDGFTSSIREDAAISNKDWIDLDTLASPECGIEFVLAVERPCMEHINVPGHQSHVPMTGHALMASSSLLSFAPSPTQANCQPRAMAALQATRPSQANGAAHLNLTSQANAAWTLPYQEIGRLLELSSKLDLVGHITPVEAWNRICQRCRPRGISKRALEELKRELVENAECHGFGAVLVEEKFESVLNKVLAADGG